MRRLLIVVSLSLFVLATASSVLADTTPPDETGTFHFRSSGSAAAASYTDLPSDVEMPPPGDYFFTDVWASDFISVANGEVFDEGAVCLNHSTFTIDANGDWIDWQTIGECVSGAEITLSRRLTSGRVVAAVPVSQCTELDPETKECLVYADLGTVQIDLDLTGFGRIDRYHGASSGGSAGNYQFTNHSAGSSRAAAASGSVDLVGLDGSIADLTGGAAGTGSLSQSRDGYTDVFISQGQQ